MQRRIESTEVVDRRQLAGRSHGPDRPSSPWGRITSMARGLAKESASSVKAAAVSPSRDANILACATYLEMAPVEVLRIDVDSARFLGVDER